VKLIEALQRGVLSQRVLLGDGANGTLIQSQGFHRHPYDLANLYAPEIVRATHAAYFEAGSDFVETNTYQANAFRLPEDVSVYDVNFAGAQIAREAAGPDRMVMGAIGPAGKPMEPIGHVTREEVWNSVSEQARALVAGGVDGFVVETFVDLEELRVAIQAIRSVTDLPIIALKAFIEDGEMLAEGLPLRAAQEILAMGVAACGANCVVGPQRMLDLVRQMAEVDGAVVAAFPTPGIPQLVKGQVTYDSTPEYFAKAAIRLAKEGARIIGGCCGTTPAHIAAVRKLLDQGPVKVAPRRSAPGTTKAPKPLESSPPSPLAQKLGREFVTAVEMDVPRGLNLDGLIAGAELLKEHGVDVVNISDGARARLRMNPTAVCSVLKQRADVDVTMHFACRDRNLLAIQSDLLGAHALGIRNILAVTGDPANIGDYPSATSVFDIDSIGLCRILARFNEGIDLAGYSIGIKCGFTIACAFNPLPIDLDGEMDRLCRKVEAGAQVIYTQPVFDRAGVDLCMEAGNRVGLPVLVGVLPLKSSAQAEFMHHEVPGISVPDELRKRMAEADPETALRIGIEEAQGLGRYIREVAQGLYLMPPSGSATLAIEVIDALGA